MKKLKIIQYDKVLIILYNAYIINCVNESDENDDIHSYYLYKHIYCDRPSVYFSIISAKLIKLLSKHTDK